MTTKPKTKPIDLSGIIATTRLKRSKNYGLVKGTKQAILDRLRIVYPVSEVNAFSKQLDKLIDLSMQVGILDERLDRGNLSERLIDLKSFEESER